MHRSVLLLTTLALVGAASSARGDGPVSCGDAFDQSQVKRDEGKLLEARKLLRVCAGATCSPTQQRLCSDWLTDVNARIPSVVLVAKDASGADLVDVKVLMDGVPIATMLDGRAIDVDPGAHTFVFERADGTKAEARAVADERGKGRAVTVTLGAAPPTTVAPVPASPNPTSPPGAPPPAQSTTSSVSPLKTVGIVVGVAGVIGLGIGTGFGVEALSMKAFALPGRPAFGVASNAYSQATVSTVGFIAGGALLAGGVVLFLAAPSGGSERPAASVRVSPMVGASAGGLQLAGAW